MDSEDAHASVRTEGTRAGGACAHQRETASSNDSKVRPALHVRSRGAVPGHGSRREASVRPIMPPLLAHSRTAAR
eukprot:8298394-Alexandrium_andersonii.AAC.1